MSEIKVANASAVFPSTTKVKAYAQKGPQPITPQTGAPAGASAAEGEVEANGELTITGLVEKTFYLLAAEVAGTWKYLHVYCEATGETVVIATQATGDFAVTTAGKGFRVKEGANAKMGTGKLAAGKVVIANTSVTATSRIFLQRLGEGAHIGSLSVKTVTAATSFEVISSNAEDTDEFNYLIFEPA
jgi:hypothetical protein